MTDAEILTRARAIYRELDREIAALAGDDVGLISALQLYVLSMRRLLYGNLAAPYDTAMPGAVQSPAPRGTGWIRDVGVRVKLLRGGA